MLLTMSSCGVNCNTVTCTGYTTDVSGYQHELQKQEQYYDVNVNAASNSFLGEFTGEVYMVVGKSQQLRLDACKCKCD